MNIFRVFQTRSYRIHETGFSAFLGYLLNTSEDHGLSDTFLKKFLNLAGTPISDENCKLFSEIIIEGEFFNSDRKIDIELRIYKFQGQNKIPVRNFIIENKIKMGAVMENQLSDYYQEYLNESEDSTPVTVVFITPNKKSEKAESEFKNLTIHEDKKHSKIHLRWTGSKSISSIFKRILFEESIGELSPLNEQIKHTMRAFRNFLESELVANTKKHHKRQSFGTSVREEILKFDDDREFTIILRDSGQIEVIDNNTGSPVVAKSVIQDFIHHKGLKLPTEQKVNTRTMGKKLIESFPLKKAS